MKRIVLDTNIYIGWMNAGQFESLVVGHGCLRYLSAVVLMELSAGARTRPAQRAVDRLQRAYQAGLRILVPTASDYARAGATLARLRTAGREVRRASLVNDVLIALSARAIGATVITADAGDYDAIRHVESFSLEVVQP